MHYLKNICYLKTKTIHTLSKKYTHPKEYMLIKSKKLYSLYLNTIHALSQKIYTYYLKN